MQPQNKGQPPAALQGTQQYGHLEETYRQNAILAQMCREKQILADSFAKVQQYAAALGPVYTRLQQLYASAQTVYCAAPSTASHRVLYGIYQNYFALIAVLAWGLRRKLKADTHIRRMKRALKNEADGSPVPSYWGQFAKWCLPFLAVGTGAEIVFLYLLGPATPLWQQAISFAIFIAGFAAYVFFCYKLEGVRLYGSLQKWLRYRAHPRDHSRPLDIVQTAKLTLPLCIAVLSALIKLYTQ